MSNTSRPSFSFSFTPSPVTPDRNHRRVEDIIDDIYHQYVDTSVNEVKVDDIKWADNIVRNYRGAPTDQHTKLIHGILKTYGINTSIIPIDGKMNDTRRVKTELNTSADPVVILDFNTISISNASIQQFVTSSMNNSVSLIGTVSKKSDDSILTLINASTKQYSSKNGGLLQELDNKTAVKEEKNVAIAVIDRDKLNFMLPNHTKGIVQSNSSHQSYVTVGLQMLFHIPQFIRELRQRDDPPVTLDSIISIIDNIKSVRDGTPCEVCDAKIYKLVQPNTIAEDHSRCHARRYFTYGPCSESRCTYPIDMANNTKFCKLHFNIETKFPDFQVELFKRDRHPSTIKEPDDTRVSNIRLFRNRMHYNKMVQKKLQQLLNKLRDAWSKYRHSENDPDLSVLLSTLPGAIGTSQFNSNLETVRDHFECMRDTNRFTFLKKHQSQDLDRIIASYFNGIRRILLAHDTGLGKTILVYCLMFCLFNNNKVKKITWIGGTKDHTLSNVPAPLINDLNKELINEIKFKDIKQTIQHSTGPDLYIIDECHTLMISKEYKWNSNALSFFQKIRDIDYIIYVSATPYPKRIENFDLSRFQMFWEDELNVYDAGYFGLCKHIYIQHTSQVEELKHVTFIRCESLDDFNRRIGGVKDLSVTVVYVKYQNGSDTMDRAQVFENIRAKVEKIGSLTICEYTDDFDHHKQHHGSGDDKKGTIVYLDRHDAIGVSNTNALIIYTNKQNLTTGEIHQAEGRVRRLQSHPDSSIAVSIPVLYLCNGRQKMDYMQKYVKDRLKFIEQWNNLSICAT